MSINYNEFSNTSILEALPQNRPLYKDSGLWQVRSDDMENVICQQSYDEPFREFLIRYAKTIEDDPILGESFRYDITEI